MAGETAPFAVQPKLTQIAMAVKPQGLIADQVCPRVPVEGEKFVYTKFTTEEAYQIPDTHVGRISAPNTVEFGGKDVTESVQDYGLDDVVPNRDIQLAKDSANNYDPLAVAAERTALLVELAREKRVADLYFDPATYNANLKTAVAAADQWSASTSDPLAAIMDMFDAMLIRPNVGVLGRPVWSKLRRHPKIVAAVLNSPSGKGNGGAAAAGLASLQAVADLLELDAIYVGESFYNTAKKGQAANYNRLWGKHAAFLHLEKSVKDPRGALPTFGFTAQWGERVGGTMDAPRLGLKGSTIVRVGEQVKELAAFQEAGCFFQNAIA